MQKGYLKESETGPPAHVINVRRSPNPLALKTVYVTHDNYGRRGGEASRRFLLTVVNSMPVNSSKKRFMMQAAYLQVQIVGNNQAKKSHL